MSNVVFLVTGHLFRSPCLEYMVGMKYREEALKFWSEAVLGTGDLSDRALSRSYETQTYYWLYDWSLTLYGKVIVDPTICFCTRSHLTFGTEIGVSCRYQSSDPFNPDFTDMEMSNADLSNTFSLMCMPRRKF